MADTRKEVRAKIAQSLKLELDLLCACLDKTLNEAVEEAIADLVSKRRAEVDEVLKARKNS